MNIANRFILYLYSFLFCTTSFQYSFKFMTEDSILICKLIGLVIGNTRLELENETLSNNSIPKTVQNSPFYYEDTKFKGMTIF